MADNQRYIDTLNELLQGEMMAMYVYKETEDMQGDEQVMKMLSQFAKAHEEHAHLLAERIRDLGGNPKIDIGIGGTMATMSAKFNAWRGPSHLLKQVYDGEDKGVHAYEDRIDELDSESQELAREIMDEDHGHLQLFKERMESEKEER